MDFFDMLFWLRAKGCSAPTLFLEMPTPEQWARYHLSDAERNRRHMEAYRAARGRVPDKYIEIAERVYAKLKKPEEGKQSHA